MIPERKSDNHELVDEVEKLTSNLFDGYQLVNYMIESHSAEFRNSVKAENSVSYKHGLIVKANIGDRVGSLDILGKGVDFWKKELEMMKEQINKISPMKEFYGYPEEMKKTMDTVDNGNQYKEIDMKERITIVDHLIDVVEVEEKTAKAGGILESTEISFQVKNSNNIDSIAKTSFHRLILNVSVKRGEGSNTVNRYFRDLVNINPGEIAINSTMNAVAASIASRGETGNFPVVLEPAAVEQILFQLSKLTSGAAMNSNFSCLKDFIGNKIFDSKLSINDDPFSVMTAVNLEIDGEGIRKEFYPMIQEGYFTGVIHDHLSATGLGCKTTGHGSYGFLQSPSGDLQALNMVMQDGSSDYEEMLNSTVKGFQISNLRISSMNPVTGDMICTTGDGVYKIESGEIVAAIREMVFSGNIIKILSDIPLIGAVDEARVYGCPHMKINGFKSIA